LLYELARSNPSQLPPHNLDRAKYFLSQSPELLRDFARSDLDDEWFERLVEWGHLDFLLKGAGDYKDADVNLAQRLTQWLLDRPDEWMVKLIQYRETIDPTLVEILFRKFEKNDEIQIDVNDLRKLLEFFRVVIERDHTKIYSLWMEKVFLKLIEGGVFTDAIWLFTTMTHVHTKVKKGSNYRYDYAKLAGEDTRGIPRYRLEFEVDFINESLDHRAREYIKKVFLPNIREVGYPLIRALTSQFYATRITLKRTGNGNYTHYFRRAIEPHEQNVHIHEAQHFFIDTFRDLFEALLSIDPKQARKIFEEWREIDDLFFNRLSLHAARILLERKHA